MSLAYILATVGIGLMIGLTGAGSAIGTAIGGQSVLGMIKKAPDKFVPGMILAGLPATQGLYGFVGFFLYNQAVQPLAGSLTVLQGGVCLGAGIALGVAALISAIQQGKVCANGIAAMGSGHNTLIQTMILAALPEFYAILSLVAAIMMQGLLKA